MNELKRSGGCFQTAVSLHPLTHRPWGQARSGGPAQLAAAILARYGQGTAVWQPVPPIFLQMGLGQTAVTHHHTHQASYQLRPRLNLVLLRRDNHAPAANETGEPDRSATAFAWQPARPAAASRQIAALVQRLQRQETSHRLDVRVLAQRLSQQHQTLDALAAQPRPLLAANQEKGEAEGQRPLSTPLPPTAGPVPRIVRQTPPARIEQPPPTPQQTEPTARPTAPFGAIRWEMGNQATIGGETAVDLNRLTDQVMQKLEYRLQAHRERTGRF